MKVLYFDCFSGISGDMTLGALLDLGISQQEFLNALKKLNLDDEYEIVFQKSVKNGISGLDVKVKLRENHDEDAHQTMHEMTVSHQHEEGHHHHDHHHDHHSHNGHYHHSHAKRRNFSDIREIIENSELKDEVKEKSIFMFQRLAEAEAQIHNTDIENVHFHEVGAVDAIVDIVGASICMDMLRPDRIISSPVNVGGGMIKIEHGIFPVPAPATLELLKGVPIYARGTPGELVTPTGAVILTTFASEFSDFPSMVVERIGYGLGKKTYDVPNCLRVCYGEAVKKKDSPQLVSVIETNIDDMNGEIFGFLMGKLLAAGALDVYYTPIYMKKNRPAVKATVICNSKDEELITAILFRETTTLGIRKTKMERETLSRETIQVETQAGRIAVKISGYGEQQKVAPEYEDCRMLANQSGIPFRSLYQEAVALAKHQLKERNK
ncbi:MAG: nickel pincer cofactor biosynthesis protein LarC [Clostridia bacterium]|jgi:uncharacterized protein (TIGR00299 family) protein